MIPETGHRTLLALPDGRAAVLVASANRQGAASLDHLLQRAEGKALARSPGARIAARLPLADAPRDRRLRDAWRVDAQTGTVKIDRAAARALRAEQWSGEAQELRRFIHARLLPRARMLGERDTEQRLNGALTQIDRVEADLTLHIGAMTVEELASHQPEWPGLT